MGETSTGTVRTGTGTDGTASDIDNTGTGTGRTPDGIVVTDSTVSVHCQEEGCIGKYIPRGPKDFPRAKGCKSKAITVHFNLAHPWDGLSENSTQGFTEPNTAIDQRVMVPKN